MAFRSPWVRALVAAAWLAAAVVVGLGWTFLPAPAPLDAPAARFSAERARAHLVEIARRPHPIGSAEHARVRAYLVEQLRAFGLEVEVQEALSVQTRYRPARFATVRNVLARLRARPVGVGDPRGQALLLVAHYDSRGMTPGASDDGYGVATLLETARALTTTRPGGEGGDILFLFSDGEEEGLLGAHAFVESHPWAAEAGAVLNFEARGDTGPVLMFQTGDDNGALIRALGEAVPVPAANSLSQAIYRRMPNDTDLSEWLPRAAALNFANIGGFERYHAPTDTVENADLGTLQQHGEYALGLSRVLGARPLPLPREPDAVYFDVGPLFVRYPGWLDRPLAIAALLLAIIHVAVARRRGAVRARAVAGGLLSVLGSAIAAGVASGLLWALAVRIHPDYALLEPASEGMKRLHLASFVSVGAALAMGTQAALAKRLRAGEVHAATMILFAGLAVLAATTLPGAAFLFTWPVLAAVPFALAAARPDAGDAAGPRALALTLLASAPALVLIGPFVPQLFAAFGPIGAPVLSGLAALLAASAAPAIGAVVAPRPRALVLAGVAIAAALTVTANLRAPFDPQHPRPDSIFFAVDADQGKAFWLSADADPPPWAAAALTGARRQTPPLPFPLPPVLTAEARAVLEPGPEILWLPDDPSTSGRALHARVVPPPGAELLAVHVGGVTSGRVAGQPVPVGQDGLSFRFYAPPAEGVEIQLATPANGPVVIQAASQREGFPAAAATVLQSRPADRMARPGMMPPWDGLLESDRTIVVRSATR